MYPKVPTGLFREPSSVPEGACWANLPFWAEAVVYPKVPIGLSGIKPARAHEAEYKYRAGISGGDRRRTTKGRDLD